MRTKRQHLPGAAFHITARTQGQHMWFDPTTAPAVEEIILDGVASSDALLLAQIVMGNHFHIVLRQGERPLGWIMQPIMRRLALLIKRDHGQQGHAFERRYRSHHCDSPRYLRRAIAYTHMNAWRKDLCLTLDDYAFSSHGWYCQRRSPDARFVHAAVALQLFADGLGTGADHAIRNYLDYMDWRMEKDRCKRLGIPFETPEPFAQAGDTYFFETFAGRAPRIRLKPDLRDRALFMLSVIDATIDIDQLRRPYLTHARSRIRIELICALLQDSYANRAIATFFHVTDAVVSRCASQMRYAALKP